MISLLLAASLMTAQTQPSVNLCADARNCRDVGQVAIQLDDRVVTANINDNLPFVTQDGLQLFLGESVVLEVSEAGALTVESHSPANEVITPAKLSRAVAEMNAAMAASGQDVAPSTIDPVPDGRPANRLRVSLMQVPGSVDTVLLVENGYDRQIDYRAQMQVPGQRGLQYTTTCELFPRLMVLEHWPHPVAVINLGSFRTVPTTGTMTCD